MDRKAYLKAYREANKEYFKEYYKTPNAKKSMIISKWKKRGLLCEDYGSLYDRYIESKNCEECGCEYGKIGDGSGRFRCLDHDHESGLFRNFLCNRCNVRRG